MEATKPAASVVLVCAAWLGGCTAEPAEITDHRDASEAELSPDDGRGADASSAPGSCTGFRPTP